jgi:hypothetical protein
VQVQVQVRAQEQEQEREQEQETAQVLAPTKSVSTRRLSHRRRHRRT